MPTLYNKHHRNAPSEAVYIGRPSPFGNPFEIGKDGTREEVIFKYWQYLHSTPGLVKKARRELAGKDLLCFCTPKACHGDVLLRVANAPRLVAAFNGEFHFLSNFYEAPVRGKSGILYPTSEHAYQAAKTTKRSQRRYIASLPTPGKSKYAGRTLDLRPDWEEVKLEIMRKVVWAKFTQNIDLMMRLVDTCDAELVEGNYWNDRYWGVCRGRGENHLGHILMRTRKRLREKYCNV